MIQWLDDFYNDPDLRRTLMESFLPAISNYVSEATGAPVAASFIQSLAESYVDRHLGSSRAQLQEVLGASENPLADLAKRFDEWEEKRPEKVAKNELIRSANAAQVQQFREAGVEKMIWRASGGACPFCNELDGVIISVTGTFFEKGDELAPEGVESPIQFQSTIGHPPVHQGCTCFVEAVTETERIEGPIGEVEDGPSSVFREMSAAERAELVGSLSPGDQQWVADAIRRGDMTLDDLVKEVRYDRWAEITRQNGLASLPADVRAAMARQYATGDDAYRAMLDYFGATEQEIIERFGSEANALQIWANGPYGTINAHFRKGKPLDGPLTDVTERIDAVMQRTSVPTDVLVHRSIDWSKDVFPIDDINSMPTLIGREWQDAGYFATSPGQLTGQFADPSIYDVRMEIMVPQGTRGVMTNPFNRHGENELLLDRGTTLSIVDAVQTTENGRTVWNIKAVVVSQGG